MIPANLPKFLSIPNPICICSATLRLLSFPVQSFSVFTAFCSAAPLENLFISSQLLLRSWYCQSLSKLQKTQPLLSAALTQLQQLQQQAHFLQRVLLLFVSFCGCSFSNPLTFLHPPPARQPRHHVPVPIQPPLFCPAVFPACSPKHWRCVPAALS